jgi:hypothetical protein
MAVLNVDAKGGLWELYNGSIMDLDNDGPMKRRASSYFDRNGMRAYKELMLTLNGAAVGQAALATHSQVLARENTSGELGGLRTIETITDVNRVTVTADKTDIDNKILDYPDNPTFPYPVNGDGNPRSYPGG